MSSATSSDLVKLTQAFRDDTRYHRSGIVFTPCDPAPLSRIEELAIALPADIVSWTDEIVSRLMPDQRWVDVRPEVVLDYLRHLATGPANYIGRIVDGLDFALAKWDRHQVEVFWHAFVELQRNSRHAVLTVVPQKAMHLTPHPDDLATLEKDGRIIRF